MSSDEDNGGTASRATVLDNITYLHEQIAAVRASRSGRMDLAVEQAMAGIDRSLSTVAMELAEIEQLGILDDVTLNGMAAITSKLAVIFSNVCEQLQSGDA